MNGSQSPVDAYGYQYDAAGNRTVEQINTSVTTSAYNTLNQMTSRTGGGLLTITGSLNKPGTVTVAGTTRVTGRQQHLQRRRTGRHRLEQYPDQRHERQRLRGHEHLAGQRDRRHANPAIDL